MQFDGTQESADRIIDWLGIDLCWQISPYSLELKARHGHTPRRVDVSDWVCKHPDAKRPYCVEGDAFDKCWMEVV
jgi:hypothetical protein